MSRQFDNSSLHALQEHRDSADDQREWGEQPTPAAELEHSFEQDGVVVLDRAHQPSEALWQAETVQSGAHAHTGRGSHSSARGGALHGT